LQLWDEKIADDGIVKTLIDDEIDSTIFEITSSNISGTFITCPADPKRTLAIKLKYLCLICKPLKGKAYSFEIKVIDDKGTKRRFRASNFQEEARVKPNICTMPLRLEDGWNQIQLNLSELCLKAYGTNYVETLRIQIHANIRIRRIYFSENLIPEDDLPHEFKLFSSIEKK